MSEIIEVTEPEKLTWDELVEIEPRLDSLLAQVEDSRPSRKKGFNYEIAWGRFKDPISDLVGWHRRDGDPRLQTREAYEVVYWHLWHVLHD
jgi:hypothetical protein